MGTDNRLDFPLDRIAKERDEIKAEDYYIRRGTTLPGIINENIFDNFTSMPAAIIVGIFSMAILRHHRQRRRGGRKLRHRQSPEGHQAREEVLLRQVELKFLQKLK